MPDSKQTDLFKLEPFEPKAAQASLSVPLCSCVCSCGKVCSCGSACACGCGCGCA
jgi:hypothetical protein